MWTLRKPFSLNAKHMEHAVRMLFPKNPVRVDVNNVVCVEDCPTFIVAKLGKAVLSTKNRKEPAPNCIQAEVYNCFTIDQIYYSAHQTIAWMVHFSLESDGVHAHSKCKGALGRKQPEKCSKSKSAAIHVAGNLTLRQFAFSAGRCYREGGQCLMSEIPSILWHGRYISHPRKLVSCARPTFVNMYGLSPFLLY